LIRGDFLEGDTVEVDAQPGATDLLFKKVDQPTLVEK
jgi:hypothetical protein